MKTPLKWVNEVLLHIAVHVISRPGCNQQDTFGLPHLAFLT